MFIGILFQAVETTGRRGKKGSSTAGQAMTMQTLTAGGNPGVSILLVALGVVSFVFLFGLLTTWVLRKLGGRTSSATVQAKAQKFGSSLLIVATGLVGIFLAIVFVQFGGIYFIFWMIRK